MMFCFFNLLFVSSECLKTLTRGSGRLQIFLADNRLKTQKFPTNQGFFSFIGQMHTGFLKFIRADR